MLRVPRTPILSLPQLTAAGRDDNDRTGYHQATENSVISSNPAGIAFLDDTDRRGERDVVRLSIDESGDRRLRRGMVKH